MSKQQRLTWTKPNGEWGINGVDIKKVPKELYGALCKLRDYEETGAEPDVLKALKKLEKDQRKTVIAVLEMFSELEECKELENKGLLIRLPCKIGDDLYWISDESDSGRRINTVKKHESGITGILITEEGFFVSTENDYTEFFDELGSKYAFLTKDEAIEKITKF